jgi:hypothetical protein
LERSGLGEYSLGGGVIPAFCFGMTVAVVDPPSSEAARPIQILNGCLSFLIEIRV